MSEKIGQIQEQKLAQKQSLAISRQQLLQATLMELPITQLVDRINTEMNVYAIGFSKSEIICYL